MRSTTFKQNALYLAIGTAVAFVAIFILGYTSAIAAPTELLDWFKSKNAPELGSFLWDFTVVFGLAIGLPVFLALLISFRFFAKPRLGFVLSFLVGALLITYIVVPLAYDTPLSMALSRPWWGYGLELSLISSAVFALLITRWIWPNNAPIGSSRHVSS